MNVSRPMKRAAAVAAVPALVALGLLMSGCASNGGSIVTRSTFVEFTPEQQAEIARSKPPEYRIQRGDILAVAFPYENNLNQGNVVVLDDGAIGLIGVDRLVVAGLTMTQADSLITAAYAKEYREPDLSVLMFKSKGRPVYVMGEVRSPGSYDVPSAGVDVLSAISLAGGFNDFAARNGVVVIRVTPAGYFCEEVNLADPGKAFAAGLASVPLEPYDVVYVPRSRQGDFFNFTRSILVGLANITRIASDIRYLSSGGIGRY